MPRGSANELRGISQCFLRSRDARVAVADVAVGQEEGLMGTQSADGSRRSATIPLMMLRRYVMVTELTIARQTRPAR